MARGPHGNGQDLNTLLGKIVRIDVDKPAAGKPYGIPLDNPFAKGGGLPEIYAWGIRNPWGMSFDRGGKRELFEVEVGQSRWEEVNIIVKGGNYGWNLREGAEWFNPKKELAPLDKPYFDPGQAKFVDPILVYGNLAAFPTNGQGKSVTGGYVYRGKALPQLTGKYIFADWSRHFSLPQGVLYAATRGGDGKWRMDDLVPESHATGHLGARLGGIARLGEVLLGQHHPHFPGRGLEALERRGVEFGVREQRLIIAGREPTGA